MPIDYPERVVDVHTHLFNARYIPLKGILRSWGVPAYLAGPARKLFILLTGKADFEPRTHRSFDRSINEADDLGVMADSLAGVAAAELATSPSFRSLLLKSASPRMEEQGAVIDVRSDELYEVLEEIEGLYVLDMNEDVGDYQRGQEVEMMSELTEMRSMSEMDGVRGIGNWLYERFRKALKWLLEKIEDSIIGDAWGTSRDYIKFVLLMLSKETTQLDRLVRGYRPEQNVKTLIHLMMDMEHAYGGEKAHYVFYKKQIKRMKALVDSSELPLYGFVAFDPRRSKPDGLTIVQYGLARGNCGVKLYPPMGYTAYPSDSIWRDRFEKLFAYCCSEKVPILTHCTAKGFEAYEFSGVLSDPDGWVDVIDQDRFRNLSLCYGHAGGGGTVKKLAGSDESVSYPGWYATDDAEWNDPRNFARKVHNHCKTYPNVYCDFSYFADLMEDNEKIGLFTDRLARAFEDTGGDFSFADKAMYGSDWHMPRMARHAGDFLDAMIEIFDHPALVEHKDKFFCTNALRFLDLDRCKARLGVLQPSTRSSF